MVNRLVVWLPCMVIFCKNSLIIASQNHSAVSCLVKSCHDLLGLAQVSELDKDEVHDLLQGVDHEEPGQDQDLGYGKPGVGERALLDGGGGDLIDVWQHVGEAGGQDDAAPEADADGECPGQQAALTSLRGAQPAPPDSQQRQDSCKQ